MPVIIPVSKSPEGQIRAACHLSEHLSQLECPHAFIGGFAFSRLGSPRTTTIYVLIKLSDGMDLFILRERLSQMDSHFAIIAPSPKFYFSQEPLDSGKNILQQLAQGGENVLVDPMVTGSLGLPTTLGPVFKVEVEPLEGLSLPILHPSILILTKLKRWTQIHTLEHPKTASKADSDKIDIDFIIKWMSNKSMTIDFEAYEGNLKPKDALLDLVRELRKVLHKEEDTELMHALRIIIKDNDWSLL